MLMHHISNTEEKKDTAVIKQIYIHSLRSMYHADAAAVTHDNQAIKLTPVLLKPVRGCL